MRRRTALIVALPLTFGIGCARSIPEEAKQEIAKPVDCASAEADIARLEAEKVSVAEQVGAGVRSVVPVAAVAGLLRGDTKDRARVATGAYNQEIEERIFLIQQQCEMGDNLLTEDGLYQFKQARVGYAALKPGADLSPYKRLLILPVQVAFKTTRDSYELPEHRVDDLKRRFHTTFRRELEEKGGYRLVSQAGPDVLLVRPALIDILVLTPPEPTGARDRIYVSRAGEVTLVAEFRDSNSGELLARVADRREIGEAGGRMYESSAVTNLANVERVFGFWASLLRARLDEAHQLSAARAAKEE